MLLKFPEVSPRSGEKPALNHWIVYGIAPPTPATTALALHESKHWVVGAVTRLAVTPGILPTVTVTVVSHKLSSLIVTL